MTGFFFFFYTPLDKREQMCYCILSVIVSCIHRKTMTVKNPLVAQPEVWRPLFLRMLRSVGNLREAAESIGVTTNAVRAAMRKDSSFAMLVADAQADATAILEKEAWRRAMNGSDLLLMFLLKAENPEKYREKTTVNGGPTINVKAYVGFSPDQWDQHQQEELDGQTVDSTAQRVLSDNRSSSEADLGLQTPILADRSAS